MALSEVEGTANNFRLPLPRDPGQQGHLAGAPGMTQPTDSSFDFVALRSRTLSLRHPRAVVHGGPTAGEVAETAGRYCGVGSVV